MQTKLRATALAISVLVVGMLAGPAFAQEVPEGFESLEECETAVRQIEGGVEDVDVSDTLRARIQALIDSNDTAFICTVYIPTDIEPPEVLPEEPIEQPEPEPEAEEEPAPTPPGEPAEPAEVLGEVLSRTGADALTLGAIGAGLVGLGVLAVRRSRPASAS